MTQWKRIRLGPMKLQVRSLAQLNGLRIRHCQELWCRQQMWLGSSIAVTVAQAGSCSSDLTPSLGTSTSICRGSGPRNSNNKKDKKDKKKKKKKKQKKKKKIYLQKDYHRTSMEHWQNLNLKQGQEILHKTRQNKREKREREKGISMRLAILRGSCEREKEPTPWEAF